MGLKQDCTSCGEETIPIRLMGVYVGSSDSIKIWQCRQCNHLWTFNTLIIKAGI
jgi:ribosomal protein L37AE/L43A